MKTKLTYLLIFGSTVFAKAQFVPFEMLDINEQHMPVTAVGMLAWNALTPLQEVPANSGSRCLFVSNLWLGGTNNGDTFTAVDRFRTGSSDWMPGPVMTDQQTYDEEAIYWDRVWKLKKSDIQYHQQHYADYDYTPIDAIATWPGNGDVSKGQAAFIAPFQDVDQDGIYNPMAGDYPLIRGDQTVFFICNDHRGDPTLALERISPNPMKIEVHGWLYAFDCPMDDALTHAVFAHYEFFNRSEIDYSDFWVGIWNDLDIGNDQDDYVGSDVMRSMFYGYNGDTIDQNASGSIGYGTDLAAYGTIFLKGLPVDDDNLDNAFGILESQSVNGTGFGDQIIDNECWGMQSSMYHNNGQSPSGDPLISKDYYNYMVGSWKDGSILKYSYNGYSPNDSCALSAKFMFPDQSDPYHFGTNGIDPQSNSCSFDTIWNEETSMNTPGDRRMLGSTGPSSLHAGDDQSMDIAFVFSKKSFYSSSVNGFDFLQHTADEIITAFRTNNNTCATFYPLVVDGLNSELPFKLYPNPADDLVHIEAKELHGWSLFDINSRLVKEGSTPDINISELANGLYVLKAINSQTISTQQLIISH